MQTPSTPARQDHLFDAQTVVGNILSLGISEILCRVVAFVATAYLARTLGPAGFGIIGFAVALCGYFSLGVSAGFNDVGTRLVAHRPHQAASLAASVILVRCGLAVLAMAALSIMTWFLNKPPEMKLVVLLTGLSFFSLALDTSWVLKGLERSRPVGVSLIIAQALYVGIVLLVVKGRSDVKFVPPALFFGEMCAALLLLAYVFRLGIIQPNLREGLAIFRNSGFLALTRLLRLLMFTFDVVLLEFLRGEREVGLYSAPYRICLLLSALAVAIFSSYLPATARALVQGKEQVGQIAGRSLALSAAVAAPIIVGGIIVAAPLLQVLFGSGYVEGARAFQFLLLSMGFIFLHSATHNVLLVCDRLKVEMFIMAFGAALNVGLNLWFIPRYGLAGAAAVTASAEGTVLLLAVLAVHGLNIRLGLRSILPPLGAAGGMGAVLVASGLSRSAMWSLPVGGVTYLVILFLLGGIPQDVMPHVESLVAWVRRAGNRHGGA